MKIKANICTGGGQSLENKAFTLIELLAVIVILAIIALIATPIILNIINDTKESADKRSVELYGKAVENAVGNYQVKHPEDTDITFDKIQEYIKYKGNTVECDPTKTKLYKDGIVYLAGCKVDGKDVEYTYGEDKTKTVYRFSSDTISIGDTIDPTDFTTDPTTLGKDYYLKHVIDRDNKVIESYVCAVYNNKETCVRGGSPDYYGYAENANEYTGNALILKGLQEDGIGCAFYDGSSGCGLNSPIGLLVAYSNGSVNANGPIGACDVNGDGSSHC